MTIDQLNEKYHIPMEVLREYERWRHDSAPDTPCCPDGPEFAGDAEHTDSPEPADSSPRYGQEDIEALSLIMTLLDSGFEMDEIRAYMALSACSAGGREKKLCILNRKRAQKLDEIHFCEKQLERLDFLRYQLRRQGRG